MSEMAKNAGTRVRKHGSGVFKLDLFFDNRVNSRKWKYLLYGRNPKQGIASFLSLIPYPALRRTPTYYIV